MTQAIANQQRFHQLQRVQEAVTAKESSAIKNAEREKAKRDIVELYLKYDPSKASNADTILDRWKGTYEDLLNAIKGKYEKPPPSPQSPEQTMALSRDQSAAVLTKRLQTFYTKYNPSKLSNIEKVVSKYVGNEGDLFQKLVSQYGPEPVEENASQNNNIHKRAVTDTQRATIQTKAEQFDFSLRQSYFTRWVLFLLDRPKFLEESEDNEDDIVSLPPEDLSNRVGSFLEASKRGAAIAGGAWYEFRTSEGVYFYNRATKVRQVHPPKLAPNTQIQIVDVRGFTTMTPATQQTLEQKKNQTSFVQNNGLPSSTPTTSNNKSFSGTGMTNGNTNTDVDHIVEKVCNTLLQNGMLNMSDSPQQQLKKPSLEENRPHPARETIIVNPALHKQQRERHHTHVVSSTMPGYGGGDVESLPHGAQGDIDIADDIESIPESSVSMERPNFRDVHRSPQVMQPAYIQPSQHHHSQPSVPPWLQHQQQMYFGGGARGVTDSNPSSHQSTSPYPPGAGGVFYPSYRNQSPSFGVEMSPSSSQAQYFRRLQRHQST
eukprot:PhF_6_TR37880/c0_g1_i1/m.56514